MTLNDLPRTELPEVESATAREPLANSIEPLFHSLNPAEENEVDIQMQAEHDP
jgi:hypothetical protein